MQVIELESIDMLLHLIFTATKMGTGFPLYPKVECFYETLHELK